MKKFSKIFSVLAILFTFTNNSIAYGVTDGKGTFNFSLNLGTYDGALSSEYVNKKDDLESSAVYTTENDLIDADVNNAYVSGYWLP